MTTCYPHLGPVVRAQPLTGDSGRTQWLLTTDSGRFVLRELPPATDPRRAELTSVAQQHVARAGLAPTVVPDPSGRLVTYDGRRILMLSRYVEGACDLPRFPDLRQCHELGDLLGRVHHSLRAVAAIPYAVADPLQAGPVTGILAALAAHHRPDCPHAATRQALRTKLQLARALTADRLERPGSMPRQLVHGDVHPGNLVTAGGHVRAVIDFERIRLAPPGYELVRALLYCVSPAGPPAVSAPRVAAFLTGYLDNSPLDDQALESMVDLFRTVQVLDVHGLDRCAEVEAWRLRFGHARFALLRWLDLHGAWLTDLGRNIRHRPPGRAKR
jgi:Ser/Thr protein kinase RdoA (MazF antagonist)